MIDIFRIVSWIWLILLGIIFFIPTLIPVPICIVCGGGLSDPNFIGTTATTVIGIVSIVLGAYGAYGMVTAKQSAAKKG